MVIWWERIQSGYRKRMKGESGWRLITKTWLWTLLMSFIPWLQGWRSSGCWIVYCQTSAGLSIHTNNSSPWHRSTKWADENIGHHHWRGVARGKIVDDTWMDNNPVDNCELRVMADDLRLWCGSLALSSLQSPEWLCAAAPESLGVPNVHKHPVSKR